MNMALQNNKAVIVDLTQEDPLKKEPITITLEDSINQPEQQEPQLLSSRRRDNRSHGPHQRNQSHQRRRIDVADEVDVVEVITLEEEESSTDREEPARKRQHISSTPRKRPPSISPASHSKQARPDSPDNSLKCPVCLDPFKIIKKRGDKCVVTRCGHLFCDTCLKNSLACNGRKCPTCRKNVPKGPTAIIQVYDLS
jgi:hypothetical protein